MKAFSQVQRTICDQINTQKIEYPDPVQQLSGLPNAVARYVDRRYESAMSCLAGQVAQTQQEPEPSEYIHEFEFRFSTSGLKDHEAGERTLLGGAEDHIYHGHNYPNLPAGGELFHLDPKKFEADDAGFKDKIRTQLNGLKNGADYAYKVRLLSEENVYQRGNAEISEIIYRVMVKVTPAAMTGCGCG